MLTIFIVITLVMVLQVGIGIYGFYAIRTFEKYTVPVTVAIMVLMSVLAWSRPGVVNWNLTSTLPPGAHLAMLTLLMSAIGVGWGISWVTWASDYSRFVPRSVSSTSVFWYSYIGMFVPTVWLAILGATIASVTLDTDPAKMVSAVFGGVVKHPGAADGAARTDRDQYPERLFGGAGRAQHGRPPVTDGAGADRRYRRLPRHDLLHLRAFVRQGVRQLDDQSVAVDEPVGRRRDGRLLHQAARARSMSPNSTRSPETSAYGDINWGGIIAFLAGLVAGWSVQDGLVPALQGPISGLLGGADFSWLFGIVVSGAVYLAISGRTVAAPSLATTGAAGK